MALLYDLGFELGTFLPEWTSLEVVGGSPTVIISDPTVVRRGTRCAKFVVRDGDNFGGFGELAQVYKFGTGGSHGEDFWYSFSVRFGIDFTTLLNSGWNMHAEFHNHGNTGQANMHFRIDNLAGNEYFVIRTQGGDIAGSDYNYFYPAIHFQREKWYDYTFFVKWREDNTGALHVWMNDSKVVGAEGIPTLYANAGEQPSHFKFGIYRDPANTATITLYCDRFRKATTREEAEADLTNYYRFVDSVHDTKPRRKRYPSRLRQR